MEKAIAPRLKRLNTKPMRKGGSYVLYWVQASPRIVQNPALELAVEKANRADVPLHAVFAFSVDFYPTLRQHTFMLEGLREFAKSLKEHRGVELSIMKVGEGGIVETISKLAEAAVEVVVCTGYLKKQRRWYSEVAESLNCRLTGVEANVVVPVSVASTHEEVAARTLRPKLLKLAPEFLEPLGRVALKKESIGVKLSGKMNLINIDSDDDIRQLLLELGVDDSVEATPQFRGGYSEAKKHLEKFIKSGLAYFDKDRKVPGKFVASNLSPYLHFGQISPAEVISEAQNQNNCSKDSIDSFLEETLISRELAVNFCFYNPHYDSIASLPRWTQHTIITYGRCCRTYVYTEEQLAAGETHDQYWNACQLEIVTQGKMQVYMRMYWAKKVMEWTESLEEAYQILLRLSHRYELDGCDPDNVRGIAWCFGKHDIAFAPRAIFGKIRFMNEEGLRRKFRSTLPAYVNHCYAAAGKRLGKEREYGAAAKATGQGALQIKTIPAVFKFELKSLHVSESKFDHHTNASVDASSHSVFLKSKI